MRDIVDSLYPYSRRSGGRWPAGDSRPPGRWDGVQQFPVASSSSITNMRPRWSCVHQWLDQKQRFV